MSIDTFGCFWCDVCGAGPFITERSRNSHRATGCPTEDVDHV
jgi:hypothetical protein